MLSADGSIRKAKLLVTYNDVERAKSANGDPIELDYHTGKWWVPEDVKIDDVCESVEALCYASDFVAVCVCKNRESYSKGEAT